MGPGNEASDLVLQATPPGAKRPPCMTSAFLGKYASIAGADLIQLKKLDSQNSNLTEARFDFLWSITIMTVIIHII